MNKAAFFPASIIALLLAGCAAEPQQVAEYAPCKVAPLPVASLESYGGPTKKPVDKLDKDYATFQLRSTPYYRQQLQQRSYANNTLAEATRDCY